MARILLRLVVGLLFIGHGTQKLFGWFGGHGLEGTGQFFESGGLRPGHQHAQLAGASETAGGTLLALGFLTPVAAAMLTGVMSTAFWTVHKDNGPWITNNGYEFVVTNALALFALTEAGPGSLSLDAAMGIDLSGPGWAMAELAAGVGGTALVLSRTGGQEAEPPPETATAGA
jgi:putative oxidoreductase